MFTKQQFISAAKDVKTLYTNAGLERTWKNEDAFSDSAIEVAWGVCYSVERATKEHKFYGLIIGGLRSGRHLTSREAAASTMK